MRPYSQPWCIEPKQWPRNNRWLENRLMFLWDAAVSNPEEYRKRGLFMERRLLESVKGLRRAAMDRWMDAEYVKGTGFKTVFNK